MNKEKGFVTLIELLLGTVLMSIMALFLIQLSIGHSGVISSQKAQISADVVTRSALDEMGNKIREGKLVLPLATISGNTYTTGSQAVVVQVPSVDSSGVAIPNSSDVVVFTNPAGTTNLLEIVSPNGSSSRPGANRIITNKVFSLNFTYNNADLSQVTIVDIDMSSFEAIPKSQKVFSDKISVTLRNK